MFDDSPSGLLSQPPHRAAMSCTSLFAQLDAHTESNFFTGYSGDLRDGGLFVATYEPLQVGESVQVELSLPGGRFVTVHGRVAWERIPPHGMHDLTPGVGVVLHDLDEETAALIHAFMGLREPSFVDPDVLSCDATPRSNASTPPPTCSEDSATSGVRPAVSAQPRSEHESTVEAAPELALAAGDDVRHRPSAQDAPSRKRGKRHRRGKRR